MALTRHITTDDDFFLGEDKTLTCVVYQPGTTQAEADADTGARQDIAGWSISWMLKRRDTDPDAAAKITKTTAGGTIVLTTPASGLCTVTLTDDDTSALPAGVYKHELKRTDPGSETVLLAGLCVLRQAVHR